MADWLQCIQNLMRGECRVQRPSTSSKWAITYVRERIDDGTFHEIQPAGPDYRLAQSADEGSNTLNTSHDGGRDGEEQAMQEEQK